MPVKPSECAGTHISEGLLCSFPFPKHPHRCSCPHCMEEATRKAQQRKNTEQKEKTWESSNPVSPVLSPVQATLTEQLATPADLLAGHRVHPSSPLRSRSPASGTGEPLSALSRTKQELRAAPREEKLFVCQGVGHAEPCWKNSAFKSSRVSASPGSEQRLTAARHH